MDPSITSDELNSIVFDDLNSIVFDDDASVISNVTIDHNPRDKFSSGIITLFPPDDNPRWLLPTTYFSDCMTNGLLHWCGQMELATTTGTLHIHIYAEFHPNNRKRFSFLTELFSRIVGKHPNIQKSKRLTNKSRKSAVNYVLKPDTFLGGDDKRYIWPHNKLNLAFDQKHFDNRSVAKQSKQSKQDIDEERRLHIESKPRYWTWDQILHENATSKTLLCTCSWGSKYHAGRHAEIPERHIKDVVIFYGAGGTGKTTMAHNWDLTENESQQERYYRRNPDDGNFWGGGRTAYKGQRIIHFEEFCGQEPLSRIKEVCDLGKTGPNVNVKNGGTTLNHEIAIFTSNHHPAAWFKNVWRNDPKQFHPFWRRVTQIYFFPSHKEDGTLNIPDSTTPPYYLDHTDLWKAFQGDYDTAVQHACDTWPIKEEPDNYGATAPGFNH